MGIMDNKVVFITGATRGIGFATAKRMLEENCEALGICGSNEKSALKALDELKAMFPEKAEHIHAYWPSLFSEAEIARDMKDFHDKYGRLDAACSNAGISHNVTIKNIPEGDFKRLCDINLTATYYVNRQAGLLMRNKRKGSIVNTASMTGLYGSAMGCGYGASKGGVIALTKSLGRELGFFNIRVNCVAPGSTKTDITKDLNPAALADVNSRIALKRMGEPEEVANAILFFASDLSTYCTATCLSVDGFTV